MALQWGAAPRGRGRLLGVVALLSVVGSCTAATGTPVPTQFAAAVQTQTTETVGVEHEQGGQGVLLVSRASGRADVSTSALCPSRPCVHFSSFTQADRGVSDTYAYGLAPPGTARVETTPSAEVAAIGLDGAWVAVIPNADLFRPSVSWRFIDRSGGTLAEGAGAS